MNKELLKKVQSYCTNVMTERLDPNVYRYHNLTHVKDMVEVAKSIIDNYEVDDEMKENLQMACWFHDVGYVDGAEGHEERGAELMRSFLAAEGLSQERIGTIQKIILATRIDSNPKELTEQIIKDADCHHVGTRDFFAKTSLLKEEMEVVNQEKIDEKSWLTDNLKFLHEHKFYTPIAESKYNDRKRKNTLKVQKQLTNLLTYENNVVEFDPEKKDISMDLASNKADRGIETMFRVTLRNHNNLSVIADNKANIMLSINSIMLSIVLSSLASKLDTNSELTIPTILLTTTCVVSIILAVFATRPKISKSNYSDEAFMNKKINLLFFGNFFNLPLDKFEWGINTLMNNEDMLYSSLTKDLYFLGVVLARKYKILWYCYNIFTIGIIITALSFIWVFATMTPENAGTVLPPN